jgi:hypothetical protein
MITYRTPKIEVWLDGYKAGEIRESLMTFAEREKSCRENPAQIGWRYYPSRSTNQGDWFPTLEDCKRSLEAL